MAIVLPKRRFTVFEYHKMVEAGILSGLVGLLIQDAGWGEWGGQSSSPILRGRNR
jgi:hypothetical protein